MFCILTGLFWCGVRGAGWVPRAGLLRKYTHTHTPDQPRPNMKRTSYLSYKFILLGGSKKGQPLALQLLNLGQSLELNNPLLEFSMIQ